MPVKVHPISKDLEEGTSSVKQNQQNTQKTCGKICEEFCCDDLFGKNCFRTIIVILIFVFISIYLTTVLCLSLNNQNTTLF